MKTKKDARYILGYFKSILTVWSKDLEYLRIEVEQLAKESHDTQTLLLLRSLESLIEFLRGFVDTWATRLSLESHKSPLRGVKWGFDAGTSEDRPKSLRSTVLEPYD